MMPKRYVSHVKCDLVYPDDSEVSFAGVCFSFLTRLTKMPTGYTSVRYAAPISDDELTDPQVAFYCEFMSRVLPYDAFTWRIVPATDTDLRSVIWTLNIIPIINNVKRLLYLSAFRYVDEYPSIISDLYLRKGKNDEDLFAAFQRIHVEYADDSHMMGHWCLSHALMYPNGYHPISIAEFVRRIADNTILSIHSHFARPKAIRAL